MNRKLRVVCWTIAIASTALGVTRLVLPPDVSVPALAPMVTEASAPATAPAFDPTIAEEIAIASIFSPSRTPPSTRYAPPEFGGDSANGMMAVGGEDMVAPQDSLTMSGDVPRLFGTVVGPAGTFALLHLDATTPEPRLYAVGERDGGYTVLAITPRAVVLRGAGRRVTLRLDSEEDRP